MDSLNDHPPLTPAKKVKVKAAPGVVWITAEVDLMDGASYFVPTVRRPAADQIEVDLRQGRSDGMGTCMVTPVRVRIPVAPAAAGPCLVVVSWSRRNKTFVVTVPPVTPEEEPTAPFVATIAEVYEVCEADGTFKRVIDGERPLRL